MAKIQEILFHVLSCVVNDREVEAVRFEALTAPDWDELYKLSKEQGVTALVFDKIKALPSTSMSKQLLFTWLSHTQSIEKQMSTKRALSDEFMERVRVDGLQFQILKGQTIAAYYPKPFYREYGDLDCRPYRVIDGRYEWEEGYEIVNTQAEKLGAQVRRDHYKHSHITYKGLSIENHHFVLAVRASKRNKMLERHLRTLVEQGRSADFNALFLTAHALSHFLFETIRLRHLMDWALFLKGEQNNIDWTEFWSWCDRMRFTEFVSCLNALCVKYLNLALRDSATSRITAATDRLSERLFGDIIDGETLYNKGHSAWQARAGLVVNFFRSSWKYRKFLHTSSVLYLLKLTIGFFFERNPKV